MSVHQVNGPSVGGPKVDIDPDIAAAARISPTTWAYIVTLIVLLAGWGATTLANNKAIEAKADKEVVEQKFDALAKQLDSVHEDVREIRKEQIRQAVAKAVDK